MDKPAVPSLVLDAEQLGRYPAPVLRATLGHCICSDLVPEALDRDVRPDMEEVSDPGVLGHEEPRRCLACRHGRFHPSADREESVAGLAVRCVLGHPQLEPDVADMVARLSS